MRFWTHIVIVICVRQFHRQKSMAQHRVGTLTLKHYAGQSYACMFNGDLNFKKSITAGLDLGKKIRQTLYSKQWDCLCTYGWILGKSLIYEKHNQNYSFCIIHQP